MARSLRRVEKPRELTETEPRHAAREEPSRESHGVDHRRADARARKPLGLPVEEREVEARIVRDEHAVSREGEESLHGLGRPRRSTQLLGPEAGHGARSGPDREPWIDEGLELGFDLEAAKANGSDLADPGLARAQARRLEVDHDIRRLLEQERRAERLGECHGVAAPRESSIGLDDVCEQRARERNRRLPESEEPPRRVLREHRSALLLDELHQAVGRI